MPPVIGSSPSRFDPGGGGLLMNAPLGGGGVPPSFVPQQQQMLPLMSFGPPFLMQPQSPLPANVTSSLAHLQQQQQQQLREGNQHNNHSGHTHAIQLQTSLEMAPVVCPALCEIRTQLQELTRSVESCQNEVLFFFFLLIVCSSLFTFRMCCVGRQVSDMKRDMSTMRHDVESVHHVKEDIDDLRDCIDKLQEQNRRRKMRLLEQVSSSSIDTATAGDRYIFHLVNKCVCVYIPWPIPTKRFRPSDDVASF